MRAKLEAGFLIFIVACGSTRTPDQSASGVTPTPSPPSIGPATGSAHPALSAPPVVSSPPASASPGPKAPESRAPETETDTPKLCGCSLCEPLVSDDKCTTDADCAPSTPCHAPKCVAKAKAEPRPPGLMCTMMMACHSADANKCGCHQGRCALIPRK